MFGSLRTIAIVSMLYDLALGLGLLMIPGTVASFFGIAPPAPPLLANLVGLFALAVAASYLLPLRDPVRWAPLLWILGPFLKGGGALLFIADHVLRGSPAAFLVFALMDGTLALWTAWALRRFEETRR